MANDASKNIRPSTAATEFALNMFLGESEYNELFNFYKSAWGKTVPFSGMQKQYNYRVFLEHKGHSLNEFFFENYLDSLSDNQKNERDRLVALRESTFLTQTGLFAKADKLAEHYKKTGYFPKILISDEMVRAGHDLAQLFYTLEQILIEIIKISSEDWQSYDRLHTALLDAIDFRAYARTDRSLLLEPLLKSRIEVSKTKSLNEIYSFFIALSQALAIGGEFNNTSFIPTFTIPGKDYEDICSFQEREPTRWKISHWENRDILLNIWTTAIPADKTASVKAYCMITARKSGIDGSYKLTPYVFWDSFTDFDLEKAFGYLRSFFCNNLSSSGGLLQLLASNYSTMQSAKFCLFYAVASTLTFRSFYKLWRRATSSRYDGKILDDFERVAQSFGSVTDVLPAFRFLSSLGDFENNDSMETLRDSLKFDLTSCISSQLCTRSALNSDDKKPGEYIYWAENYISTLGLNDTSQREARRREDSPYVSWSDFDNAALSGLKSYLKHMEDNNLKSFENSMAAIVILMQEGFISLKKINRFDAFSNSGSKVQALQAKRDNYVLRAGESSVLLSLQHMYRFVPALAKLEDFCQLNHLVTEDWAEWFGDYVNQNSEEKYREKDLGSKLKEFVQHLHENDIKLIRGHIEGLFWLGKPDREFRPIKEWTGNPWSEAELEEYSSMNMLRYFAKERDIQQYYLKAVSDFYSQS